MAITRTVLGPAVDAHRLLTRLQRLAKIGADEAGGVTRPGFTAADLAGRDYVAAEAAAAGLSASVDAAGNLVVSRSADLAKGGPVVLMGSHLDTVVQGGPLDGAYGVIAGLEVLQALAETGAEMRHEPVLVAFANEEGARFPCPFWGSLALTGRLARTPYDIRDQAGVSLDEALREVGGDPDRLESAAWPPGSVAAYLELHIEQGPVLERLGLTIGVVEAIVGRTVVEIELRGRAGHAGTTPMDARADALTFAARVVLMVEEVAATRRLCAVATAGRLRVAPGVTNVVPGLVRLTAEFRDAAPERLRAAEETLMTQLAELAHGAPIQVETTVSDRFAPVATDASLRAAIGRAAGELGLATHALPSGAGHDAQIVATLAPMGMIFVPSRDGVSHVPEESTADADLVAGAQVLLRTVQRVGR
ncbi:MULTISPECIES: Zn-dependent hydrolase [unclassified Nonomuraea]|uniref:Zn-dependent hydrolase n=1 Tax=unclassified Nonomuraea TaxID=2593643 RepID=UPI0035BF25E1